ncbi:hypothetical protein [Bryocella elongata]|uniref:hypothetical protein n=1 Tax=Bryocella elongata TaxID=863522 RepID=UPI001F2396BF|nr:hypothetical protein [Bryocella elongata]
MASQAWKHMVRVLPCGSRKHYRSFLRDVAEYVHPFALPCHEPMPTDGIHLRRTDQEDAAVGKASRQALFQLTLCRPAKTIGFFT